VIVIAHRGASGHAPEHTFAAWDAALDMRAEYLEQDLQMTADNVLIVLHDDTLDRTTGGQCRGPVRQRTLASIADCDAGSWFNQAWPARARPEFAELKIPTLQEVLERYEGRARFYIETKNPRAAPGMEEELLRLIGKHGLLDRPDDALPTVIVQSFSVASLRKLHMLEPRLPLVRLFGRHHTGFTLRRLLPRVARYAIGIGPSRADTDERLVRAAHAAGLLVHPWTVNEPMQIRRFERIGVDGIFTDFPDRIARKQNP
jgi:glycerophosphoryl diester phosphodiesterase